MKVLLISIALPPKRDPESLQVAKYCKYLAAIPTVEIAAITSKNPTLFMDVDSTLEHYTSAFRKVISLPVFENKYINYIIRKINPSWLQYPDSKFTFWLQRSKALKAAVAYKPEVLYSRSYPVSSTLTALFIKQKLNIPWVLHLSDPWAISSTDSLSPATFYTEKARLWNKQMEETCFELADKVSLTSQKTIELYQSRYPQYSDKFCYYPNVYDDDFVIENPCTSDGPLMFVYTGGFGEARSPKPILDAIKAFWIKTKVTPEQVRFIFTGEMTRNNKAIFSNFENIPIIQHMGIIPYDEVRALQQKAHILINIDSDINDPEQAVFFPSKLLEYIILQRPIMAITNSYSTTYSVVHQKLGECFDFSETTQMIEYFETVMAEYMKKNLGFFYRVNDASEFSSSLNARRLFELFKSL